VVGWWSFFTGHPPPPTPGPWVLVPDPKQGVGIQARAGHPSAAHIAYVQFIGTDLEDGLANARLIAAAPELLQFVAAFAACPTEGEIPGHWSDKAAMDRMIRTARAIVAKADGRPAEGV
jgi:hypothetical protein